MNTNQDLGRVSPGAVVVDRLSRAVSGSIALGVLEHAATAVAVVPEG